LVNSFLIKNFENILDYNFTARVEKEFDEIADGKKVWNEMIKDFYGPFHEQVEHTLQSSEKVKGEKLLGTDPETGKNIYVKLGKYGPIVQLGDIDNTVKPRFAGLRKGQSLETMNLEEALDLFKLPRSIGNYEDAEIIIAEGKYGPYVKHKSDFYSLAKTDDPLTIKADRAIVIIEEKRKEDKEKIIKEFTEDSQLKVLKGKWGPYISHGRNNYKIPKSKDPASLSYEDCKEIMESFKAAKSKKRTRKSK
jgi:DNA topoisomerase-1